MKNFTTLTAALAATLACGSAFADQYLPVSKGTAPCTDPDPCVCLKANIDATMKARLTASVPKTDPSTFNQQGYDIKGIMSIDITAGFKKLMSMDFSSLADSILQKGLEQASKAGAKHFNNQINGVLSKYGVDGVDLQKIDSGTLQGVAQNYVTSQTDAALVSAVGAAKSAAGPSGKLTSALAGALANGAAGATQGAVAKVNTPSLYSRVPVANSP